MAPETVNALPVLSVSALPVLPVSVLPRSRSLPWFPCSVCVPVLVFRPICSAEVVFCSSLEVLCSICSTLVGSSPICSALVGSSPVCSTLVGSSSLVSALASCSALVPGHSTSMWTWPSIPPPAPPPLHRPPGLYRSVWKPLLGGGGYVTNPGHELLFTHHQRSLTHHMDSCTTLNVERHLRLHFP